MQVAAAASGSDLTPEGVPRGRAAPWQNPVPGRRIGLEEPRAADAGTTRPEPPPSDGEQRADRLTDTASSVSDRQRAQARGPSA